MKRDAGFSLMEVLIALAITATLSSAGTMMMVQTLNASSQIDDRMELVREQIKSDNLIRNDLAAVTLRMGIDQERGLAPHGFMGARANTNDTLLTFIRDGWDEPTTHRTRSDLQRVEYRVEDGQLLRRAWLRPDISRQTPYTDRVLYSDLKTLNIRYRLEGQWIDDWPAQPDGSHPDLVELTLNFADEDSLTLKYTVGLST